ncbi:hypothetical protein AALP_AA4G217400 [Arabis alpina]|uniref:Uncharacterized protein n=1 Tax=Arabis alpina TaxID=50452 RepID=A0A087H4T1_ARAAL|nr:hypothetical protein AALP_AA4G217400 [Arabis alpina]
MADQTLLQPFLTKPATKDSVPDSDSGILLRLFFVSLVGAISLWANHEASKGFSITIINEAKDSHTAKKFALFFEFDDTAVRVLLDTSFFVETYLYQSVPHRLKKPVKHVTVRFSEGVEKFSVTSGTSHGEYVIRLSSSLMERSDFRTAVRSALRCSMVRIWLWGDETGASLEIFSGMVEYLAESGLKRGRLDELGEYWKDKEFVSMAQWLGYCEGQRKGFIRWLNHGMSLSWDDRTVVIASYGACDLRKVVLRSSWCPILIHMAPSLYSMWN